MDIHSYLKKINKLKKKRGKVALYWDPVIPPALVPMYVRVGAVEVQTSRQQRGRRLGVDGAQVLFLLLLSGGGGVMDQFGSRAGSSSQVSKPWCALLDCGRHTAVVGH